MSKPVKFELAAGYSALWISCAGGREIAIDAGGSYRTDDAAEIGALEAHPAAKRAPATKRAAKPEPAPVAVTTEKETSA